MFCCKKTQNFQDMSLLLIISISAAENVVLVVLRAAVMVFEQFGVDLKCNFTEKILIITLTRGGLVS